MKLMKRWNLRTEGTVYKGREAFCDKEHHFERQQPLWGSLCFERRASSWDEYSQVVWVTSLLPGNIFGKRKNLQTRTKTAKPSVTAELCHYIQVRKIDPIRNVTFLKLVGKGGKIDQIKSPLKDFSSSVQIVNKMPMLMTPRIWKRYLISNNLN